MSVVRTIAREIERERERLSRDARGRPVSPPKLVPYRAGEDLDPAEWKMRREFLNAGKGLRRLHRSAAYRRVLLERREGDGAIAVVPKRARVGVNFEVVDRRVGWRRFAAFVRFLKAASRPARTRE